MSLSDIPPQATYLYADGWTGLLDSHFCELLVRYKNSVRWGGTTPPRHVFETIRTTLNERLGLQLSMDDVVVRMKFLVKRYKSFKRVTGTYGALHISGEDFVRATRPTWLKIIARDSFAQAYYREAEPEWHRLLILFGPSTVKQEIDQNVVVLSDTTEQLSLNDVEDSEDETVTSPVANPLRRELFPVDGLRQQPDAAPHQFRQDGPARGNQSSSSSCSVTTPRPWR